MGVRLLKDETELRGQVLAGRKAFVQKRPIRIHIRGGKFSEQDRKRLESEIQEMVTAEVEQALSRDPEKRSITVSLPGLPLPDRERIALESKIEKMIATKIPRGRQEQDTIVCGCWGPFGCCDPPGQNEPLDSILPLPAQRPFFVGLCFSEDVLAMRIDDGGPFNLNPMQMIVGLTSSTSWAKEIDAWGTCICTVSSVRQNGPSSTPATMLITQDQTTTLVFRKPKFLGVWTDMYHFEPTQFWALGGSVLTFNWDCDNCQCGP